MFSPKSRLLLPSFVAIALLCEISLKAQLVQTNFVQAKRGSHWYTVIVAVRKLPQAAKQ
jgi:hypothetical protein